MARSGERATLASIVSRCQHPTVKAVLVKPPRPPEMVSTMAQDGGRVQG